MRTHLDAFMPTEQDVVDPFWAPFVDALWQLMATKGARGV